MVNVVKAMKKFNDNWPGSLIIPQKSNAEPKPIRNFWMILMIFILVKFSRLKIKVDTKIIPKINKISGGIKLCKLKNPIVMILIIAVV